MFSITGALEQRYMETVDSVQPPSRWKLIVVDSKSLKLLNAACKMYKLMERNVTLVQQIEKPRDAFPNLEALYFLTPNPDSVALMVEDFTRPEPMYAAAHLFFTSSLHDGLFRFITTSRASKFVKSCRELMVDFFPLESRVFSLDRPNLFYSLFGPDARESRPDVDATAKQLISVLATIGENPIIRYHRPSASESGYNRSKVPEKLAFALQAELDAYAGVNEDFPPKHDPPQPRAILYVLDRTIDITATLVHEFTYQAMANDLLPIEGGNRYVHEFSTGGGEATTKEVILDEDDAVWVDVRHSHIAKCSGELVENFRNLVGSNKAAGMRDGASLNDMKDILADLPQFQEQKAKYSAHISIAQECMNLFERHRLGVLGAVEQDMACRETPEGSTPKGILKELIPLLDDDAVTQDDVLRLFLLYTVFKEGLKPEDMYKLQEHSRLPKGDIEAVRNLEYLGLRVTKEPSRSRDFKRKMRMPKWPKKKDGPEDEEVIELSRYVPEVKRVLENHLANRVDDNVFPYTREVGIMEATEQVRKAPTSLRSNRANWQRGDAAAAAEQRQPTGSKIIIFIAGGMTYSEMRSVYEVSAAYNRDVIIGSTHVITPGVMLRDLRRLRQGPPPPPKPPTPPPNLPPQAPTAAMGNMSLQGQAGGSGEKKKKTLFGLKKSIF